MTDARSKPCGTLCPRLIDDDGFTTISMAVAMVLTLALLFSAAQITRLQTETAEIQEVADASALAAENIVAEYMIVVRVCDAVVLSMSLLALAVYGVSVVLLLIPFTQGIGGELIDIGSRILSARTKFADKASEGLTKFQKALPYLSAANAAAVAAANSASPRHSYLAVSILVPETGDEVAFGADGAADAAADEVASEEAALAEAAQKAEEAARAADEAKRKGYEADCGNYPEGCMRERAEVLAGLTGAQNPDYASPEVWSFANAFTRARTYYQERLAREHPLGDSIEEQSNSALRTALYSYAVEQFKGVSVNPLTGEVSPGFPKVPRNTDEMRATTLYTDARYPVTINGEARTLHAWSGCPGAADAIGFASIKEAEEGAWPQCDFCHFKASDLGKVAAASSSIDNGFEYYYREVAEAYDDVADAYDDYRERKAALDAASKEAKDLSSSLFDKLKEAMKKVGGNRISLVPPGADGAVVIVADLAVHAVDDGLASSLLTSAGVVMPRAAVSAATLIEEPEGEGGSVISSLLDGFGTDAEGLQLAGQMVVGAWSKLLQVYTHGPESIGEAIDGALENVPLLSEAGLGKWAAGKLQEGLDALGLEPAELDALKPVLVNTGRVTAKDDGAFSVRFRRLKEGALELVNSDGSVFGDLIDSVRKDADSWIKTAERGIEIACIELPIADLKFPIVITLPQALTDGAHDLVDDATEGLKNLIGSVIEGPIWR